jgi:YidC/Oxa1 family membrane protein insertase
MDSRNVFVAIILSMIILFGYQYLFVSPPPPPLVSPTVEVSNGRQAAEMTSPPPSLAVSAAEAVTQQVPPPSRPAREVMVETEHYVAKLSEAGGLITSFRLKKYRENNEADAPNKELIQDGVGRDLPLFFSWGTDPTRIGDLPFYEAGEPIRDSSGSVTLNMTGRLPAGLVVNRKLTFNAEHYQLDLAIEVVNNSDSALQGSPYLSLVGQPFSTDGQDTNFLFNGPAVLLNDSLEEVKIKDLLEDGPKTFQGNITWSAFEDTYFMMAVAPDLGASGSPVTVRLASEDGVSVSNILSGSAEVIAPGSSRHYNYTVYFGPKKMVELNAAGHDFNRAINFGWFGFVAKPVLVLLNFLYGLVGNYGVAIILVTVLIKLFFWPISHKGMKSMKGMQKIQPKLAQIREKYKDDKERMAQEQMQLYKTYKINPLGGCLPMLLQIPVFFALYRVLMQAIELRHAPFMLWITDLSTPERLPIGFELPYLGGLPVLTILMGGSMFLQQKMTPTPAANPEMAKMMMFMPVIFTFLFINFASGLVLYFFVNNLLQMAQQYYINRAQD